MIIDVFRGFRVPNLIFVCINFIFIIYNSHLISRLYFFFFTLLRFNCVFTIIRLFLSLMYAFPGRIFIFVIFYVILAFDFRLFIFQSIITEQST